MSGHIKALKTLGQTPHNNWSTILVFLITSKLDVNTRREWERETSKLEAPQITELIKFLESRFRMLETIETSKQLMHFPITRPVVINPCL